MIKVRDLLRLIRTVRYLRPSQVFWRIWFRIHCPMPDDLNLPRLRLPNSRWALPCQRYPSMLGPTLLRFLNVDGELSHAGDWNDARRDKLWLYNLHYFDDLNAGGAGDRIDWHQALLERWIKENPPFAGNGWEPYPISLRVVNCIKWFLQGNSPNDALANSLALQVRYLRRRIEYHLLGNHLLANAKALFFAGMVFDGVEADEWLETSLCILDRELPEQILPDGGHFELSPMYHAIIVEDLLDLINLLSACGYDRNADESECRRLDVGARPLMSGMDERLCRFAAQWPCLLRNMRRWLRIMSHPDGDIAFFNDAALGIAPKSAELERYAARIGLSQPDWQETRCQGLDDSGYVRLQCGSVTAILDVGRIGPDYLPGHAHADTLSFEMSFGQQRVLVNSGVSCYGDSPERVRQRGTAAHNTVTIDGENSSEVWSGFRVARRCYPKGLQIQTGQGAIRVACSHDGYQRLPGAPVHRRSWQLRDEELIIRDQVSGGRERAVARYHLHPSIRVEIDGSGNGKLAWDCGASLRWSVQGALSIRVLETTYHPEFGRVVPNSCIEIVFGTDTLTVCVEWGARAASVRKVLASAGAPKDISENFHTCDVAPTKRN